MKDLHFTTEAETEKAVLDCIAKGIKFQTVGRTHIIIFEK